MSLYLRVLPALKPSRRARDSRLLYHEKYRTLGVHKISDKIRNMPLYL